MAEAAEVLGYVPDEVATRVRYRPLDLFGTWPAEAHDVHLMCCVLHDWDDASCAELLARSLPLSPK